MHPFQQLLEEAGLETRSYSGRAMYGKTCLAVDLDGGTLGPFVADVIEALQTQVGGEIMSTNGDDISEAFRSMKTDSMGRGSVVYFPGVPFEDGDGDDASAEEAGDES